jgi:uncharacterized protein
MSVQTRAKVRFTSGREECVAFHYPGTNGACVVMGPGGGVTKEPGTDQFAARFHHAGFSVLAFDYRHFGESGGTPRQVIRINRQLADWEAALAYAATLPEVDRSRIAAWGFSLAGGHLLKLAARPTSLFAAAIAQTPYCGGLAVTANALRHESPDVIARFPFIAAHDLLRSAINRDPRLIPLAGPRGTVAMLTTPDAQEGDRALNPENRHPNWVQAVAARSVISVGSYRPGSAARQVRCPVLLIAALDDQSVLLSPVIKAARRAPEGELFTVPGGHYAPFLEQHETVVTAELTYLNHHLLSGPPLA